MAILQKATRHQPEYLKIIWTLQRLRYILFIPSILVG